MSKARQQSLARAIRRGNAIVSIDGNESLYYTYKKGSSRYQIALALKNQVRK